ncbi:MAG: tetratricopeptide repeat protein [Aestuariivirga sp.]
MAPSVDQAHLEASPTSSHAEPPQDQLDALNALYNQGRLEEVVRQATAITAESPNAVILYNILGAAYARLRNMDGAIASFSKALQIKPDYAEAHNNLGLALQSLGRFEEAIASFSEALHIKPDYAEAHNNLGAALKYQGRLVEAIASFSKALQIKPDHAEAHNNLGAALQDQGRLEEALASYGKALQIKPDFVQAHSNLCGLYEKQNNIEELERALEKATLYCGEDDSNILFRLAQLANRKNQFEDAVGYLEKVQVERIRSSHKEVYFSLLGKVCDKLGRFDEAFSAFVKQNELARVSVEAKKFNADRYQNSILLRKAAWTTNVKPVWTSTISGMNKTSPTFLVGFPRSGTTLLDTILRSHTQITVIEEKPMVGVLAGVMSKAFAQAPTIHDLNTLSETDVISLQDIYFKELKMHLDQAVVSKRIVDKFPLNIVHVGLIHRVFPDAKLILALRHPCDCVLSCFMQTFKLNDAMANFLSLDQSARLYAAVMELWLAYQQKLELDVHVLKYEDLVQDFEGTCKSLISFLGLEWDDNLHNYQKTALDRSSINTASYHQVVQPLYKQAIGRWVNYREQMQPVLPVLRPWIEAFGY